MNELAKLTGKAHRTIEKRLEKLPFEVDGKSHLYDSKSALEAIYLGDKPESTTATLTEARTEESLAKAEKTRIEIETMQRQRIPIDVINDAIEPVLALHKQIIMGSKLTDPEKREICESLRDIPRNMKW